LKRLLLPFALLGCWSLFAQEHAPETPGQKASEHAEAAAEEHEMPNEIWWKWANFAILAAGLGYLIGKNAGPFFASRSAEIQKGITEAAAVKAEAEARAREIEGRISNLTGEIQALRKNSQEEIAAEGTRIKTETAELVAKIQAQSEQEVASAIKNASLELKAQAAELALGIAEQQIRGRLTPATQDGLVSSFVEDLKHEAQTKAARN
jgi:F-type H+-transporting ATPase subunit b